MLRGEQNHEPLNHMAAHQDERDELSRQVRNADGNSSRPRQPVHANGNSSRPRDSARVAARSSVSRLGQALHQSPARLLRSAIKLLSFYLLDPLTGPSTWSQGTGVSVFMLEHNCSEEGIHIQESAFRGLDLGFGAVRLGLVCHHLSGEGEGLLSLR